MFYSAKGHRSRSATTIAALAERIADRIVLQDRPKDQPTLPRLTAQLDQISMADYGMAETETAAEQTARSAYALLSCREPALAGRELEVAVGLAREKDSRVAGDQKLTRPESSVGRTHFRCKLWPMVRVEER